MRRDLQFNVDSGQRWIYDNLSCHFYLPPDLLLQSCWEEKRIKKKFFFSILRYVQNDLSLVLNDRFVSNNPTLYFLDNSNAYFSFCELIRDSLILVTVNELREIKIKRKILNCSLPLRDTWTRYYTGFYYADKFIDLSRMDRGHSELKDFLRGSEYFQY